MLHRRRKVKCDEVWPVCHRCESTGRACDGYGIWGGGSQSSSQSQTQSKSHLQYQASNELARQRSYPASDGAGSSPPKCVQLIPFRQGELECFEWFMHRSCKKLPGVFHSSSWTTVLFQASTTQSAVRHAILALGSAHKEEVRGDGYLGREVCNDQALFTVTQYSKSIRSLQTYFTDDQRASTHVTLISCALFISMEFLRGSYVNALLHLEYGLNLLTESESSIKGQDPWSVSVDGWVITLFTRKLVQAKLLGKLQKLPCQKFLHLYEEPTCDIFRSIHHARRSLERVIVWVLDIQEQNQQLMSRTNNTVNQYLLGYKRRSQEELQRWLDTRDATVAALPPTTDMTERFAYRLLLLYYQVAVILTGTCLDIDDELCFDRYESTFLEIVSHCIWTYNLVFPNGRRNPQTPHDPEPTSPNSVSGIGWIGPLYLTAIKCRNPRIRRQAIRLLQSSVHKEGIWNAALVIPIAQKVVEIEEGGLYDDLLNDAFETHKIPTAEDLEFPTLPIESRVSRIDISLPKDRAGRLVFTCCRSQSSGVVEFICEEYDLRSQQWDKNVRSFQNKFTSTKKLMTTSSENDISYAMQDLDELIT